VAVAAGKLKGLTFGYIPDELLFSSSASSNAKVIYSALTRYLNQDQQAWPTQQTLARRLSWSTDTVKRAINELVRLGWLTKEQCRVGHGEWASNLYTLRTQPTTRRTKLRRRANLHPGADQGKQSKPAGHNRSANLHPRTRENEFKAKSNASRLGGAPRSPRAKEDCMWTREELAGNLRAARLFGDLEDWERHMKDAREFYPELAEAEGTADEYLWTS
jgi:DNA-binding Lrp family transcriptional regulator